ncbi:MAG: hypothetical protein IJJ99_08525 [Oscillospiraceae bacterium]|nr:hypothetical protein [Oscillospiraceae bacterium]
MKTITRLLAILLTLALIFSLAACGDSKSSEGREKRGDEDEKTTEEVVATEPTEMTEETEATTEATEEIIENSEIVGAWEYEMDMMKVLAAAKDMDAMPEQYAGMMDYMGTLYDGMFITVVMELGEDKTCSITAKEESLKEAAKLLEERLPAVLPELLAATYGITLEELEAQITAAGMTMEDYVAAASSFLDSDTLLKQMTPEEKKGTYVYEDGKLLLTYKDGSQVTYTVELDGDELTVTNIEGKSGEYPEAILPMVFVRAGEGEHAGQKGR